MELPIVDQRAGYIKDKSLDILLAHIDLSNSCS
jgi:hypothetical protein